GGGQAIDVELGRGQAVGRAQEVGGARFGRVVAGAAAQHDVVLAGPGGRVDVAHIKAAVEGDHVPLNPGRAAVGGAEELGVVAGREAGVGVLAVEPLEPIRVVVQELGA